MKKLLAILLALALTLALAACGGEGTGNGDPTDTPSDNTPSDDTPTDGGSENTGVDLSKYPQDLGSWSAQNLIDYFTEIGLFTEGSDRESWFQDHANYWSDTPFNECSGYWDEAGLIQVMFFTFDDTLPDTTPEDVQTEKEYIKANKMLSEDYSSMPIDHMVGNVAVSFTYTTDDDFYNKMEAAWTDLVKATGAKADF